MPTASYAYAARTYHRRRRQRQCAAARPGGAAGDDGTRFSQSKASTSKHLNAQKALTGVWYALSGHSTDSVYAFKAAVGWSCNSCGVQLLIALAVHTN